MTASQGLRSRQFLNEPDDRPGQFRTGGKTALPGGKETGENFLLLRFGQQKGRDEAGPGPLAGGIPLLPENRKVEMVPRFKFADAAMFLPRKGKKDGPGRDHKRPSFDLPMKMPLFDIMELEAAVLVPG